jgi:hypothetical protein
LPVSSAVRLGYPASPEAMPDMATGSLNFITFNQDHSCLAVGKSSQPNCRSSSKTHLTARFPGSSKGFRIYHTDPFSKIFSSDDGNVAIIEMLFSTSLVALILSPRHLIIQNTKVGEHISRAWDGTDPVLCPVLLLIMACRELP